MLEYSSNCLLITISIHCLVVLYWGRGNPSVNSVLWSRVTLPRQKTSRPADLLYSNVREGNIMWDYLYYLKRPFVCFASETSFALHVLDSLGQSSAGSPPPPRLYSAPADVLREQRWPRGPLLQPGVDREWCARWIILQRKDERMHSLTNIFVTLSYCTEYAYKTLKRYISLN